MAEQSTLSPTARDAFIDGDYRYLLTQSWGEGPRLVWVMLNPSTADHTVDDPTIRRVRRFTEREGYNGFTVVNLYSLRATNPATLTRHPDPVGWHGDVVLHRVVKNAPAVVVAWGGNPMARRRGELIRRARPDAVCLGHNRDGSPRHPLYLPADTPLVPAWEVPRG